MSIFRGKYLYYTGNIVSRKEEYHAYLLYNPSKRVTGSKSRLWGGGRWPCKGQHWKVRPSEAGWGKAKQGKVKAASNSEDYG